MAVTYAVCVALISPLVSSAQDASSDPVDREHSSGELGNQSDTPGDDPAELPPSLKRLFGESVPFPDPDRTGVELYALAMQDAFLNTTGGASRGGGLVGNLFLSLAADTDKMGWWSGGKLVLEGIGVYGRQPSKVVGDYQYTSSIDAPDTFEPYELYYEQSLFDGRFSVLAGVHDYSLDFAVLGYGWEFIHSSFWTPSTLTQIWWSFYPTTGLGSRAKLKIGEHGYAMAGVYDGNPTDQSNNRKIDWGLSKRDGAHTLTEIGAQESEEGRRPFKVALGGWYNSGEFEAADGTLQRSNSGLYAVGEALLVAEDSSYDTGLGGFFQVGQADRTRNFNTWYFGAGLRYKGLFESREQDVLAFGWGRAQIGSTFREANPGTDSFEGNMELTYRAVIEPWLTVQPSIQLITNPGANSTYDDAVVLYLRSEVLL